jgi:DNA-binding MarR family transcriptional regulator
MVGDSVRYPNYVTHEEQSPTRALPPGRVAAWLAKQVEIALADAALSLPQYRVLALLADGSAASSFIAERLAVRPPTITAVVDGLVCRGLVDRSHTDADRRRVDHVLTVDGQRVLAAADEAVSARLARLASFLGDDALAARAVDDLALWGRAMRAHRSSGKTAEGASIPLDAGPTPRDGGPTLADADPSPADAGATTADAGSGGASATGAEPALAAYAPARTGGGRA